MILSHLSIAIPKQDDGTADPTLTINCVLPLQKIKKEREKE
jgi:hypothetical protein